MRIDKETVLSDTSFSDLDLSSGSPLADRAETSVLIFLQIYHHSM